MVAAAHRDSDLPDHPRRNAAWCAVGFYILMLPIALRVRIDYWDGYDWLISARALIGAADNFRIERPALLTLLMAPIQHLGVMTGNWELTLVLSHAVMLLVSAWFIALALAFIAPETRSGWVLAAALLGGNLLVMDYATFVMGDLTMAGCFLAAWRSWESWRSEHSLRAWTRFCVWNLLGVTSKHVFPVLWIAYPLSLIIRRARVAESGDRRSELTPRLLLLRMAAVVLATALINVLVTTVGLSNAGLITLKSTATESWSWWVAARLAQFAEAASRLLSYGAEKSAFVVVPGEPPLAVAARAFASVFDPLLYLRSFVVTLGWPAAALCIAGLVLCGVHSSWNGRARALALVWMLFAFSVVIRYREARYLTVALPFVVALAVAAFERGATMLCRGKGNSRWAIPAALLVCVAIPLTLSAREWWRMMTDSRFHGPPARAVTEEQFKEHDGFFVLIPNETPVPDSNHARFVVGWSAMAYSRAAQVRQARD